MFFIDKYAPHSIETAFFHKNELEKAKTMSMDSSVPHIIFYGPEGSGKKSMIRLFLEMLYDKEVHNTRDVIYNVTGNSSKNIPIKQSNYHIVIEPNNNNFDRYIIHDVVKEYAQRIPLNVFSAKMNFKTVLINNVDNLSFYAQTSLRRTMELYSNTCRFIMWSRSLSKVIDPLRSRCYCFRIKSPSNMNIFNFLIHISAKENINLGLKKYNQILQKANGNIKKALWLLELYKFSSDCKTISDSAKEDGDQEDSESEDSVTSYEETILEIVEYLLMCDLCYISDIRDDLYNIMITNIPGSNIIKDIVDELMKTEKIPWSCKLDISEIAAIAEDKLIKGRREIIHLELFIIGVMDSLQTCKKYSTKD